MIQNIIKYLNGHLVVYIYTNYTRYSFLKDEFKGDV